MKAIWKTFSTEIKNAWYKTVDAIGAIFKDFMNDVKALLVQTLDLFTHLICNIIKSLEVFVMGFVLFTLTALAEAIFDTAEWLLEKFKSLFSKE